MSAADPGEEGLLVGAGAFKVDRAHALEKLRLYQLPPSVGGWLLWARCAAASGAREAELKVGMRDFSLSFGGGPFSRAELSDPFAPLFGAAGPRRERGFTLALGLLQALASDPKEVWVESGVGSERVRMTARSLEDVSVAAAPASEPSTRMYASWPLGSESRDRFLNQAYMGFRPLPLFHADRLTMKGVAFESWPASAASGRSFRLGGALGRIALPAFYTPPDSHLSLYKLGVFVCEQRAPLPWAKVQAWVNDDKLSLSAAQTGVVADARFSALMRLVARETSALAFAAAREQPALMAQARAAMGESREARRIWELRMRWGSQTAFNAAEPSWWRKLLVYGAQRESARNHLVLQAAERNLWLKDVAARLKGPGRTPPQGLGEAVRTALEDNERPD